MSLPITLTELGFAIVGILVGAFSKVSYWIILETLEQRKRRREWYSDVASLANRANNSYNSNSGSPFLPNNVYYITHESANELKEIEKELSNVLNQPVSVDFSVENDANALYDALTDLNDHLDVEVSKSDDGGSMIPVDVNESSAYGPINNSFDRIAERSLEVNDKATKKARGGYTIPILNVKV